MHSGATSATLRHHCPPEHYRGRRASSPNLSRTLALGRYICYASAPLPTRTLPWATNVGLSSGVVQRKRERDGRGEVPPFRWRGKGPRRRPPDGSLLGPGLSIYLQCIPSETLRDPKVIVPICIECGDVEGGRRELHLNHRPMDRWRNVGSPEFQLGYSYRLTFLLLSETEVTVLSRQSVLSGGRRSPSERYSCLVETNKFTNIKSTK